MKRYLPEENADKICFLFRDTGTCRFGEKCTMRHITSEQWSAERAQMREQRNVSRQGAEQQNSSDAATVEQDKRPPLLRRKTGPATSENTEEKSVKLEKRRGTDDANESSADWMTRMREGYAKRNAAEKPEVQKRKTTGGKTKYEKQKIGSERDRKVFLEAASKTSARGAKTNRALNVLDSQEEDDQFQEDLERARAKSLHEVDSKGDPGASSSAEYKTSTEEKGLTEEDRERVRKRIAECSFYVHVRNAKEQVGPDLLEKVKPRIMKYADVMLQDAEQTETEVNADRETLMSIESVSEKYVDLVLRAAAHQGPIEDFFQRMADEDEEVAMVFMGETGCLPEHVESKFIEVMKPSAEGASVATKKTTGKPQKESKKKGDKPKKVVVTTGELAETAEALLSAVATTKEAAKEVATKKVAAKEVSGKVEEAPFEDPDADFSGSGESPGLEDEAD